MNKLRTLIANWLSTFGSDPQKNRVANHFSKYLAPQLAQCEEQKLACFNIRHRVYCEELGLAPTNAQQIEKDQFDAYSTHSLVQHLPTACYAGTVRVVRPQDQTQLIPLQQYCADAICTISSGKIHPNDFKASEICEISRLAIPLEFRRRGSDEFVGAATGMINEFNYTDQALRCFPYISIGLYLSAAAIVIDNNISHSFVLLDPRLATSMKFVGIHFEKIGPTIDYYGPRAPYYINAAMLQENLSPGFKLMLNNIRQAL